MNLSDYINIALEEIARGIKKADATYKTMGGRVLTSISHVPTKNALRDILI